MTGIILHGQERRPYAGRIVENRAQLGGDHGRERHVTRMRSRDMNTLGGEIHILAAELFHFHPAQTGMAQDHENQPQAQAGSLFPRGERTRRPFVKPVFSDAHFCGIKTAVIAPDARRVVAQKLLAQPLAILAGKIVPERGKAGIVRGVFHKMSGTYRERRICARPMSCRVALPLYARMALQGKPWDSRRGLRQEDGRR